MNSLLNFHFRRSGAGGRFLCLSLCFSLAFTGTETFAQKAFLPVEPETFLAPEKLESLEIPDELGTIQEVYRGKQEKTVVLIQDAHSVYEAQKSVEGLVNYFRDHYSLGLTGAEGGTGVFNPVLLQSYPDPEYLRETMDAYLRQGELSGIITAAVQTPLLNSKVLALEESGLYEKTIRAYRKTLEVREINDRYLREVNERLEKLKSKFYSPPLRKLDREEKIFRSGQLGDFSALLETLTGYQSPKDFPLVDSLWREIQASSKPLSAKALEELESLLNVLEEQSMTREETASYNQKVQAYRTSQLDARAASLFFLDFAKRKHVPMRSFSRLKKEAQPYSVITAAQGPLFLEEIENYLRAVKSQFLTDSNLVQIESLSEKVNLLERLTRLQLTLKDWRIYDASRKIFLPENLSFELSKLDKELPVEGRGFEISSAEEFYEAAVRRDKVFAEKILKEMDQENQQAFLFLSGGFHSGGLTEILRQLDCSYILISPRIKAFPEGNPYERAMKAEISWKNHFQIEDGVVDLEAAFFRGIVRRLDRPEWGDERSRKMRTWREELLRRLAASDDLDQAKRYTRFLDEIQKQEDRGIERVQIDAFLENLRESLFSSRLNRSLEFQGAAARSAMPFTNINAGYVPPDFVNLPGRSELRVEIPSDEGGYEGHPFVRLAGNFDHWKGRVHYLENIRNRINPLNRASVVWYAHAGGDVIHPLLSVNPETLIMSDALLFGEEIESDTELDKAVEDFVMKPGALAESSLGHFQRMNGGVRHLIKLSLRLLGVSLNDIRLEALGNDTWRLEFFWRHPADADASIRTVYFLGNRSTAEIVSNLENLPQSIKDVIVRNQGLDTFIEKGPNYYSEAMSRMIDGVDSPKVLASEIAVAHEKMRAVNKLKTGFLKEGGKLIGDNEQPMKEMPSSNVLLLGEYPEFHKIPFSIGFHIQSWIHGWGNGSLEIVERRGGNPDLLELIAESRSELRGDTQNDPPRERDVNLREKYQRILREASFGRELQIIMDRLLNALEQPLEDRILVWREISGTQMDQLASALASANAHYKILSPGSLREGDYLFVLEVPGVGAEGLGQKELNKILGEEKVNRLIELRRDALDQILKEIRAYDFTDEGLYSSYKEDVFRVRLLPPSPDFPESAKQWSSPEGIQRLGETLRLRVAEEISAALRDPKGPYRILLEQPSARELLAAKGIVNIDSQPLFELNFGISRVEQNKAAGRLQADINAHQALTLANLSRDSGDRFFQRSVYRRRILEMADLREAVLIRQAPGGIVLFEEDETGFKTFRKSYAEILRKRLPWESLPSSEKNLFVTADFYAAAQRYFDFLRLQDYIKKWELDFGAAVRESTKIRKMLRRLEKLRRRIQIVFPEEDRALFSGTDTRVTDMDVAVLDSLGGMLFRDSRLRQVHNARRFHSLAPALKKPVYVNLDVKGMGLMNVQAFQRELQQIEKAIRDSGGIITPEVERIWRSGADDVTEKIQGAENIFRNLIEAFYAEAGRPVPEEIPVMMGGDEILFVLDGEIFSGDRLDQFVFEFRQRIQSQSGLEVRMGVSTQIENLRRQFASHPRQNDIAHAALMIGIDEVTEVLKKLESLESKGLLSEQTQGAVVYRHYAAGENQWVGKVRLQDERVVSFDAAAVVREISSRSELRALPESVREALEAIELRRERLRKTFEAKLESIKPVSPQDYSKFSRRYSNLLDQKIREVLKLYQPLGLSGQITLMVTGSLARRAPTFGTDIDVMILSAGPVSPDSRVLDHFVESLNAVIPAGVDMPTGKGSSMYPLYTPSPERLAEDLEELDVISLRNLLDSRFLDGDRSAYQTFKTKIQPKVLDQLQSWVALDTDPSKREDLEVLWETGQEIIDEEDFLDDEGWRRLSRKIRGADILTPEELKEIRVQLRDGTSYIDLLTRNSFYYHYLDHVRTEGPEINWLNFNAKTGLLGTRTLNQLIGFGRVLYGVEDWNLDEYDRDDLLGSFVSAGFLTDNEKRDLHEIKEFLTALKTAINLSWSERFPGQRMGETRKDTLRKEILSAVLEKTGLNEDQLKTEIESRTFRLWEIIEKKLNDTPFEINERSELRESAASAEQERVQSLALKITEAFERRENPEVFLTELEEIFETAPEPLPLWNAFERAYREALSRPGEQSSADFQEFKALRDFTASGRVFHVLNELYRSKNPQTREAEILDEPVSFAVGENLIYQASLRDGTRSMEQVKAILETALENKASMIFSTRAGSSLGGQVANVLNKAALELGEGIYSGRIKRLQTGEKTSLEDYEARLGREGDVKRLVVFVETGDSLVEVQDEERKQRALVFVIDPEVLSLLSVSEVMRVLRQIALAPAHLREFYREELGLRPNPESGITFIGRDFLNRLAQILQAEARILTSA